jgi:uncharacterized membrane protein
MAQLVFLLIFFGTLVVLIVEQRFYKSQGDGEDQSSRYARNGMMFLSIAFFVIIISAVFLLIGPH